MRGAVLVIPADETLSPMGFHMHHSTISPTNQTWPYFPNTISDLFLGPTRGAVLVIPLDETLSPTGLYVLSSYNPTDRIALFLKNSFQLASQT